MFSCLSVYYGSKGFVKETQTERLNNDPEKHSCGSNRDVVIGEYLLAGFIPNWNDLFFTGKNLEA